MKIEIPKIDGDLFRCKKCKKHYKLKDYNKNIKLCKDCFLKSNMLKQR